MHLKWTFHTNIFQIIISIDMLQQFHFLYKNTTSHPDEMIAYWDYSFIHLITTISAIFIYDDS